MYRIELSLAMSAVGRTTSLALLLIHRDLQQLELAIDELAFR